MENVLAGFPQGELLTSVLYKKRLNTDSKAAVLYSNPWNAAAAQMDYSGLLKAAKFFLRELRTSFKDC